ncbi:MAG: helix-turn-helix domain-containing protein [Treponema sp.]|jgi:transcriptional regulator with XRE-family HTH domain|nr:helix-turn-helix domain-containing protein [Treponema sp.]
MGFRENLKAELANADMRVKELAELSGIKKQTIDSYLRENGYTPSAMAAVNIARALGVSVEYLVTGKEIQKSKSHSSLHHEFRPLIQFLEQLNKEDRKIVINNACNLAISLQSKKVKDVRSSS